MGVFCSTGHQQKANLAQNVVLLALMTTERQSDSSGANGRGMIVDWNVNHRYCKLSDRLRDIFAVARLAEQFEFWRHRGLPDGQTQSTDSIVDIYDGNLWKVCTLSLFHGQCNASIV